MRLRAGLAALSLLAVAQAAPALAHGSSGHMPPPMPFGPMGMWGGSYMPWSGAWQPPYEVEVRPGEAQPQQAAYDRDSWLRECRRRLGDKGVGGALIGGAVGGLAGNVIAGHGDKLVGTVAGAAVGAIAGTVIDKAEDAPRVRDRCEAMLEDAQRPGPQGYAPQGYAQYGYAPMMMVPGPQAQGNCKKVVTTTTEYVDVPRRTRYIPRRPVADKRIPIK